MLFLLNLGAVNRPVDRDRSPLLWITTTVARMLQYAFGRCIYRRVFVKYTVTRYLPRTFLDTETVQRAYYKSICCSLYVAVADRCL